MTEQRIESFIASVIVAGLLCYGWKMIDEAVMLERHTIKDRVDAAAFQNEAGIDVWGAQVHPPSPPGNGRSLVFLLRGASFREDWDFWSDAAKTLAGNAGLRLVGYCDGDQCAELVRKARHPVSFPVIQYGESADSQILIDADRDGYCIERSGAWMHARTLGWRVAYATPRAVIQEALK